MCEFKISGVSRLSLLVGHSWGTEYGAKGKGSGCMPLRIFFNWNFYKIACQLQKMLKNTH